MTGAPLGGKPSSEDYIPVSVYNRQGGLVGADGRVVDPYYSQPFPTSKVTMSWILEKITKATPKDYAKNRLYYDGDHWQRGTEWSGPSPEQSEKEFRTVMDSIQKSFVSKNCVAEVADRQVSGIAGLEPTWSLTPKRKLGPGEKPTEDEQLRIDEAEAALTTWWDDREAHLVLQEALVSGALAGRAVLRLYVPSGLVVGSGELLLNLEDNGEGSVEEAALAEALEHIYIHHPTPDQSTVVTDPKTMRKMGVYAFRDESGTQHGEVVYVEGRGSEAVTVVRSIFNSRDAGAQTNVSVVQKSGEIVEQVADESTNASIFTDEMRPILRGRMTMFEIKIPKIITEQVRSLQRSINTAYTMATENIELAGFLERTILNGQMPGHYEDIPNQPGKQRFIRDPYYMGGGAVNFIAGIPQYDGDNKFVGLTQPSIIYKDPVSPENFEKTIMMHYSGLLQQVNQSHYLMASDQYASGESRKQARADFEKSLRKARSAMSKLGRWLIETALSFASWLAGFDDRFDDLRVVFTVRIDPGPATTESIRSAIELYNNKGLSNENMMVWSGVEDPIHERRLIDREVAEGVEPLEFVRMQQAAVTAQANLDAQAEAADRQDKLAASNNQEGGTTRQRKNGAQPQSGRTAQAANAQTTKIKQPAE